MAGDIQTKIEYDPDKGFTLFQRQEDVHIIDANQAEKLSSA